MGHFDTLAELFYMIMIPRQVLFLIKFMPAMCAPVFLLQITSSQLHQASFELWNNDGRIQYNPPDDNKMFKMAQNTG